MQFTAIARRQVISKKSLPLTLNVLAVVKCFCRFPEELEETVLQYYSASQCVCKNQWYFRFSCLFFLSVACRSNRSKLASEKKDFLIAVLLLWLCLLCKDVRSVKTLFVSFGYAELSTNTQLGTRGCFFESCANCTVKTLMQYQHSTAVGNTALLVTLTLRKAN